MTASDKKVLAIMPKLDSRRVDRLLEDVIGCRWTISVLRAVSEGVKRPGALEPHIHGSRGSPPVDSVQRSQKSAPDVLSRILQSKGFGRGVP